MKPLHPFVVKHYVGDPSPTIKGNGFDGLQVGKDRQEAQEFVDWINKHLQQCSEVVERDAERIDIIQKKRATIYRSEAGHWVFVDETNRDRLGIIGKDVRDVIDKAMHGTEPQGSMAAPREAEDRK